MSETPTYADEHCQKALWYLEYGPDFSNEITFSCWPWRWIKVNRIRGTRGGVIPHKVNGQQMATQSDIFITCNPFRLRAEDK